ncbi:hypothetical protein IMCC20628_04788 (plasmid) [Hoeflea sp. IMCC20628]|jgi:ABC-type uncharacterized transport system auxiliary subunit|uniref:hypothetical protein n=1 Tax=Hoeflea sp. IMCC20628 TaxID=1620421 RepID=UPI00063BD688|nr:hypothetical protein [Hoeflea sp. IMCC20628]AKI03454.1 hypothetical protein IMCC20628_04788 [Hoeflea sp. IMCC20628]
MFRYLLAAAMPLALAGCTAANRPADVFSVNSPVESDLGIRSTHHHTVLNGYTHRVPVDPKPWRQQNDDRAPGAGAGS